MSNNTGRLRVLLVFVVASLAAVACGAARSFLAVSWTHPDPLLPVAEVEGIFALTHGVSALPLARWR